MDVILSAALLALVATIISSLLADRAMRYIVNRIFNKD